MHLLLSISRFLTEMGIFVGVAIPSSPWNVWKRCQDIGVFPASWPETFSSPQVFLDQRENEALIYTVNSWLVVSTPLKQKYSVGITIPNIWKNNPNVPDHQPE